MVPTRLHSAVAFIAYTDHLSQRHMILAPPRLSSILAFALVIIIRAHVVTSTTGLVYRHSHLPFHLCIYECSVVRASPGKRVHSLE